MPNEQRTLSQILNNPYGYDLQRLITGKKDHPSLRLLGDPAKAMRFMTTNLRGSYFFARYIAPLYGAGVLASLTELPPIGEELGEIVRTILSVIEGELCNNNIFDRSSECHSHFRDALEAYAAADGDMMGIQEFFDLVDANGVQEAMSKDRSGPQDRAGTQSFYAPAIQILSRCSS